MEEKKYVPSLNGETFEDHGYVESEEEFVKPMLTESQTKAFGAADALLRVYHQKDDHLVFWVDEHLIQEDDIIKPDYKLEDLLMLLGVNADEFVYFWKFNRENYSSPDPLESLYEHYNDEAVNLFNDTREGF